MSSSLLADLHLPMMPFLRRVLAGAPLARSGVILDLACGDRAKWPLYRAVLGPLMALIGIDQELSCQPPPGAFEPNRDAERPIDGAIKRRIDEWRQPLIIANAHALPFVAGCLDGAVCVAALGLFSDPGRVLDELRRTLRPGGVALFVTAEQRWVYVWQWSPGLTARIAAACRDVILPLADPDLTDALVGLFDANQYWEIRGMAALLDDSTPAVCAVLALARWEVLEPIFTAHLSQEDLAACESAERELALRSVTLAAWGMVGPQGIAPE